jgi:hypothetical protein
MEKTPFDPITDLTYVIGVSGYTFGLAVRTESPWRTMGEFVAFAKANPDKISYGTPGTNTSLHITMEEIAYRNGIKWTHVPHKGAAPNVTALLGGHIDASADSRHPWEREVAAGEPGVGGQALRGASGEVQAPQAGELVQAAVDALGHGPAVATREEVAGQERHLAARQQRGTDRRPPPAQGGPGEPAGPGVHAQPALGLPGIEVGVTALLPHDAAEEGGQGRVSGALAQTGVGGLGRPFVDGSPGHVHRRPGLADQERADGVGGGRQAVEAPQPLAGRADPRAARRFAMRGEDGPDGFTVVHLLEVPQGEEGRDRGIPVGGGHEQVAEVADRVVLDVVHVTEAAQRVGIERLVPEAVEVDPLQGDRRGPRFEGVDVELVVHVVRRVAP